MAVENGMPENEDVRKKALLRLGVAGVITAAALAGLWWLDQGADKEKPAPPKVTAPAPIVPAQPSEAAPPQTETPEAMPDKPATPPTSPDQSETTPPAEPPPPPRVSNTPKTTFPAPQASPGPGRPAMAPAAASVSPAHAATRSAPPPAQEVPAGKGFVVQLGVFSNPDNARELLEKLNRQGIRAHLEARVQMGPFLNRQEAERAQVEMRKLGYNALVTTTYPVK